MADKSAHQVSESRPEPIGAPDCLSGKTFVFTGDLNSLSRDAAADIIKRYGGRVTGAPSKKTSFVVVGQNPGPSKMEKVQKLGISILDEDAFYNYINSFGTKTKNVELEVENSDEFKMENNKDEMKSKVKESTISTKVALTDQLDSKVTNQHASSSAELADQKVSSSAMLSKAHKEANVYESKTPSLAYQSAPRGKTLSSNELWTEKYRPKTASEIIGNTGQVEKLMKWLDDFEVNRKQGFPKGESSSFKAALISGSPGVGKTTAAHLAAKSKGFEIVEFNASDTRSKKSLQTIVKETTHSGSIMSLFTKKVLLVFIIEIQKSFNHG
jgi:replication factor C subunit 1